MVDGYLIIFLPFLSISFMVFVFLGILLEKGWSFFYTYLLVIPFGFGITLLRIFIISKLLNKRLKMNNLGINPKKYRRLPANFFAFGTIYILFNFLILVPLVIGNLVNLYQPIFEVISLFILTFFMFFIQMGMQIYLGAKKDKREQK
ncbi:hypothetical protein DTQ60_00690 [Ureaplasma urealyticum]|nr:hypothetical protein DTQ60_00690 [Ureaplasma urealyticum]